MINYFSKSLQGVRQKNDDRASVYQNDNATLAILCDGMGGHAFGDLAASIVVNTFALQFNNNFKANDLFSLKKWVFQSFDKAKIELRKLASDDKRKHQMGTTAVGVIILHKEKCILVFNAGDSRCYVHKTQGELIQITKDHNFKNQLISEGKNISDYDDRHMNYLTSAVAPEFHTLIEVFEIQPKGFDNIDKILLTSDGIHGFVENYEMEYYIRTSETLEKAANKIIDQAWIGETTDNMTLVLLDIKHDKKGGEHV
ncbi:serine/threonine-protein phosphatase [Mycoplasma sp. Pen4]|uniref:PP2C family protein-serine/threonine phosphatase n=1 Tax=Mycoplasma sp. Pen4 TaxID=640330 RepID=UPI00165426A1|nr:protein phosphatase 2C domain-containing protein [Mycoplasma sp. Pen4]QNM93404.1 serine/threonine-protein phosphatase [Mycoplasma sp. Pen4]